MINDLGYPIEWMCINISDYLDEHKHIHKFQICKRNRFNILNVNFHNNIIHLQAVNRKTQLSGLESTNFGCKPKITLNN